MTFEETKRYRFAKTNCQKYAPAWLWLAIKITKDNESAETSASGKNFLGGTA
jgi:hypothetical protein